MALPCPFHIVGIVVHTALLVGSGASGSPEANGDGLVRPLSGSAAQVGTGTSNLPNARRMADAIPGPLFLAKKNRRNPKDDDAFHKVVSVISFGLSITSVLGTLSVICHMMAGDGNQGLPVGTARDPPRWEPAMEYGRPPYTFEMWQRDLLMWAISTNVRPQAQAAAVSIRLGGAARLCAQEIPAEIMMNGGTIAGTFLDPLSYLLHVLRLRFQPLLEETSLRAISELNNFRRESGETTDSLLARFQTVLSRASTQGGMAMPPQGLAWTLLRAVGVTPAQLIQLLAPMQGIFPSTLPQLEELLHYIRRMGHVLENHPGNIASAFGSRGGRGSHAFHTNTGTQGSEVRDLTFASLSGEPPAYPVDSAMPASSSGGGGGASGGRHPSFWQRRNRREQWYGH